MERGCGERSGGGGGGWATGLVRVCARVCVCVYACTPPFSDDDHTTTVIRRRRVHMWYARRRRRVSERAVLLCALGRRAAEGRRRLQQMTDGVARGCSTGWEGGGVAAAAAVRERADYGACATWAAAAVAVRCFHFGVRVFSSLLPPWYRPSHDFRPRVFGTPAGSADAAPHWFSHAAIFIYFHSRVNNNRTNDAWRLYLEDFTY